MELMLVDFFDAIMAFLPLKQIVKCRLVSKKWYHRLNDIVVYAITGHLTKKILTGLVKYDPSILSGIEDQLNTKQLTHVCACYAFLNDQIKVNYYLEKGAVWNLKCVNYALIGGNKHYLKKYGNPKGIDKIPVSEIMSSFNAINQRKEDYLNLIQNKNYILWVIDWIILHQCEFMDLGSISLVAIKNQAFDILKFLGNGKYEFKMDDLKYVIKYGDLEMLEWILNKRSIIRILKDVSNDEILHSLAAYYGKLDMLILLRNKSPKAKLYQKLNNGEYVDTKMNGLNKINRIVYSIYATHFAALANHQIHILEYLQLEQKFGISFGLKYAYFKKPYLEKYIRKVIGDNNEGAINVIHETYGSYALGHIGTFAIDLGNLNVTRYIYSIGGYKQNGGPRYALTLMNGHTHILEYFHHKLGHVFVESIMINFSAMIEYAIQNDKKIAATWLIKFWLSQMKLTQAVISNIKYMIPTFQKFKKTFCVPKMCYMNDIVVNYAKTNHKTINHVINLLQSVLKKIN